MQVGIGNFMSEALRNFFHARFSHCQMYPNVCCGGISEQLLAYNGF